MKVVFLNSTGQTGGAENVLLDVLASLGAARPAWSLHLIAATDGLLVERARALGTATTVLPFPQALARLGDAGAGGPAGQTVSRAALAQRFCASLPATALYLRDLRRLLRRLDPDVIHTNGLKMHALGAWAQTPRASVLWHIHDYVSTRPFVSRVLRASARGCAAVVANSESVAADVRAVLSGKEPDVRAVHNAVNVERFAPDGDRIDLDALSGLPPAVPGTVRVGLVATLARWKGHDTFLRALSLLPTDSPVRGYVAGDALYQTDGSQYALEELRRMADDLGVAGRVGFTGFVEDAASVMRALDVVVHASTEPEPFGLVIAEAMACGRAVVASDAGGAAEFIRTGENALAHAPGDAAALAARISQLAHDAHLRAALGRAGRSTALRRFDRARLAAQLIPIYEELRNAECGMPNAEQEAANVGVDAPHQSTNSNPPSALRTWHTGNSKFVIHHPPSAILKVLHVHSGNLYGGVETMLATLARERGACAGLESRFALCFEGRLKDELLATGASVHVLGAARVSRPARPGVCQLRQSSAVSRAGARSSGQCASRVARG
jgi:glycosyltransferase involved in cell wall biosynthesis